MEEKIIYILMLWIAGTVLFWTIGVLVEMTIETLGIAEITMSMAEKYMALSAIGSALNTYLIVAKEEES